MIFCTLYFSLTQVSTSDSMLNRRNCWVNLDQIWYQCGNVYWRLFGRLSFDKYRSSPCVIYNMARQPLLGQGLLIIKASRSHSGTPHSVGILWTSDQRVAERSFWKHATFSKDRHPCPWPVAYPRILFGGGGVQQIQLRTEDRENGDLGAVAP